METNLPPPNDDQPILFNIEQASKKLNGMPKSAIRRFVKEGQLKRCTHITKKQWYFTIKHLEDFINNERGQDANEQ